MTTVIQMPHVLTLWAALSAAVTQGLQEVGQTVLVRFCWILNVKGLTTVLVLIIRTVYIIILFLSNSLNMLHLELLTRSIRPNGHTPVQ